MVKGQKNSTVFKMQRLGFLSCFVIFGLLLVGSACEATRRFPPDFLFGVSSSAYQIEGGQHSDDGKGETVWDAAIRHNPALIRNSQNAEVACDSYHRYGEDVRLLRELDVDFYRFSISWARILPEGYARRVNAKGVQYYRAVLEAMRAHGIRAMVTLYHWDLPQPLQAIGGWANPLMVGHFTDYARVVFEALGDLVDFWVTFNAACIGYGDDMYPPFLNQTGVGEYLCTYVMLKAHASVYRLYDETFRPSQRGRIGITIDGRWYEPASDAVEDQEAAERARQFDIGLFAHPIFDESGDFPSIVKQRVATLSTNEGWSTSRLPNFTFDELSAIRGTADFLGLNIYTSFMVEHKDASNWTTPFSLAQDKGGRTFHPTNWPRSRSPWLRTAPWGLRRVLMWVKQQYGDVDIFITENGYSDNGELDDVERIQYFNLHLNSLLDSLHMDKVNVKGYAAWSLLDNFEWLAGYEEKFGIYHVDFTHPNRTRTPKASARWYRKLIAEKTPPPPRGTGKGGAPTMERGDEL